MGGSVPEGHRMNSFNRLALAESLWLPRGLVACLKPY